MKNYLALLLLMIKIFIGDGTYNANDVATAKMFPELDWLNYLANITEFGLSLKHPDVKIDLIEWLTNK